MKQFALTTIDNPYSPLTQWDLWKSFDERHGYDTCELLGRFAKTSDSLSDDDNDELIANAMNRIISLFPALYRIVQSE